ncbi:MAG: hypothetical protein CTY12_10530 [Methylotenera sp.]|nr:MAG: hypothetical protein CTY12_10530 [Methylotenera sp.]
MSQTIEVLQQQLYKQKQLHHLVSLLLNRFLTTSLEDFASRVNESLAELGHHFKADRVYVFDYDFEKKVCHNTFEWCAPGVSAEINNLQDVPIEALPDWVNTHVQGKTMYIPSVQQLPSDDPIRQILEPQNVQSLLAVPMMRGDSCFGFVGFDSVLAERGYDSYEQRVLGDFSNALLGAVERHRIEEQREVIYQELIVAKREAEQANIAKSEFLSNMSHEIRTPLNAILGFAHLIKREDTTTKTERRIDDILQNGEHLLTLVNEILDMAKIESGSVQLVKRAIRLRELFDEIHRTFGEMARQKGLTLSFDIKQGVPVHIISDQTKVKQILINLIQNALKFTDCGQINVSVYASDRTLCFEVADTGRGIHERELDLLFEPFYQKKYTDQPQGTGLGLPISKQYALLLGGDIQVESTVRQGSRFTFVLPIEVGPHIESFQGQTAEWTTYSFMNMHILVVDDTAAHREILTDLLESNDCNVSLAASGQEAIAQFETEEFDLVLLDLRLPDMSGVDVLTTIKQHVNCPPIIIISANAFEEDRRMALDAGADAFIAKPYHPRQLFDVIKQSTQTSRTNEHALLHQLLRAIQEGDVHAIDLISATCDPKAPNVQTVLEAVNRFDYETALRLLRQELRGTLNG